MQENESFNVKLYRIEIRQGEELKGLLSPVESGRERLLRPGKISAENGANERECLLVYEVLRKDNVLWAEVVGLWTDIGIKESEKTLRSALLIRSRKDNFCWAICWGFGRYLLRYERINSTFGRDLAIYSTKVKSLNQMKTLQLDLARRSVETRFPVGRDVYEFAVNPLGQYLQKISGKILIEGLSVHKEFSVRKEFSVSASNSIDMKLGRTPENLLKDLDLIEKKLEKMQEDSVSDKGNSNLLSLFQKIKLVTDKKIKEKADKKLVEHYRLKNLDTELSFSFYDPSFSRCQYTVKGSNAKFDLDYPLENRDLKTIFDKVLTSSLTSIKIVSAGGGGKKKPIKDLIRSSLVYEKKEYDLKDGKWRCSLGGGEADHPQSVLNSELAHKIYAGDATPTWIESHENEEISRVIGVAENWECSDFSKLKDLDIKRLIESRLESTLELTDIEFLTEFGDGDGGDSVKYKLKNILAYTCQLDEKYGGKRPDLILLEGRWYSVDQDLIQRLDQTIESYMNLPKSYQLPKLQLDSDDKAECEGSYNRRIVSSLSEQSETPIASALLDKNLVILGSTSKFEICDVYIEKGCYVHTKIRSGAGEISHLFRQGVNSAIALLNDKEIFAKAEKILKEKSKSHIKLSKPRKVVFVILPYIKNNGSKNTNSRERSSGKLQSLPLLAKLSLVSAVEELSKLGLKVELYLPGVESVQKRIGTIG
ncbi:DUF6119 family protein [Corynebacterium sp. ES2775-CONJ]|uniref:DUF6119 family protein n=1 Tax=Corynebacterium sp. ES2775-CONJ TaxID=2974029 RepID=UPI002168E6E2|nr:DUF6119 family protein [Corynebacterium sp. ES2775-CONJ]MCS4490518.1 TIGR04141 family sporadically distributed protein [Corynebacterium sp. ES2775-CONJ]